MTPEELQAIRERADSLGPLLIDRLNETSQYYTLSKVKPFFGTDIPKLLDEIDIYKRALELASVLPDPEKMPLYTPEYWLSQARVEIEKQDPIISKSQMKRIAAQKGLPDPFSDFEGSP